MRFQIRRTPVREYAHVLVIVVGIGLAIAAMLIAGDWLEQYNVVATILGAAGLTFLISEIARGNHQVRSWLVLTPVRSRLLHASDLELTRREEARQATDRAELAKDFVFLDRGRPHDQVALLSRELPGVSWNEAAAFGVRLWDQIGGATPPGLVTSWYPDDRDRLRVHARQVEACFDDVAGLEPVSVASCTSGDIPRLLMSKSGAPILVESSGTRSGVFNDVVVWPTGNHRREDGIVVAAAVRDKWNSSLHATHESWSDLKPGDYDGAVLDVTEVAIGQARDGQRLDVVITANDTCYRATESADDFGCKNLTIDHWNLQPTRLVTGDYRTVKTKDSRLAILSAFVVLVTSDGYIVLAHRPEGVKHGRSILSATAGGVVEATSASGHLDNDGFVSVWKALKRETQEELGLTLDRETANPAAVWLSNSAEVTSAGDRFGQVVTVVHWYAQIVESREEVIRAAQQAHSATGSFEVDDLAFIPLNRGLDYFISAVNSRIPEMDQHGYLSCIFTALQRTDFRSSESGPPSQPGKALAALVGVLENDLKPWGVDDGRRFVESPADFFV